MGKKVGLGGAFGARYGTVARKRYVEIVTGMRQKHECPRCRIKSVRRLSVGVWLCRKCGYKFAGGAYSPFTKLGDTSRRVTGSFKPAVVETKIEAEEVEEAAPKKRRKEKAMAAEKPTAKRARKEKHKTESKRPKKPKKGASKEASK